MSGCKKTTGRRIWVQFRRDQDGLALTEYLILMGLLTSGVILAVLSIGDNLERAWSGWAGWFDSNIVVLSGPAATGGGDGGGDAAVSQEPGTVDKGTVSSSAGKPVGQQMESQETGADEADETPEDKDSGGKKVGKGKSPKKND